MDLKFSIIELYFLRLKEYIVEACMFQKLKSIFSLNYINFDTKRSNFFVFLNLYIQ